MSYSPLIHIKTTDDVTILYCEYPASSFKEHELLDVLESMVRQGMAVYLKGAKWDCYPSVLSVPKATESVMGALLPVVESVVKHDVAMKMARFHFKRTADKEDLRQEHMEWGERLRVTEKRIIAGLQALKSFPNDEGFIIEAWGTL